MKFLSELWHPSIYNSPDRKGEVCISILHPPGDDEWGWEDASERWLPVHSVESILISVISLLSSDTPCTDSPANVDAAKQVREDLPGYRKTMEFAYILVSVQPLNPSSQITDTAFKQILNNALISLYGVVNGSVHYDIIAVTSKLPNGLQKVGLKCANEHSQLIKNSLSTASTASTTFLGESYKMGVLDSANTPAILNPVTESEYKQAQSAQFQS
ncbi:hypothetical protein E3P99_03803 [Wallemia hederae]|uniref:UBC core domain-containing protein n=1 Tax=Wallemia hederae TaxID=1540922 RepID=A0A4T0FH23_9BASI|nr:hypothetical protein E3P99_03803 [Wallemia hederae]